MARTFLDWAFEGRSAKWLYVLGLIVLIVFLKFGGIPIVMLMGLAGDSSEWPPLAAFLFNRLPLIVFVIVAPLWVHFVHRRPWWSIASPTRHIEWWNLGVGALLSALTLAASISLQVAFFGLSLGFGSPDASFYWSTVLFAIAFVFMQTTSEELVFRGYGMQAVRRFTSSPVAIIAITALLFALPHYTNVMSSGRSWWALLSYVMPAVLLAWMALRTGSLWMPIGWHWLNNFALTRIVVSKSDVASGADVYIYSVGQPPLAASLALQIFEYLLVALIIHYLVSRRDARQAGGGAEAAA